ncbi:hypothetical protein [Streptomyces griseorubiginosus]|uniref:hypothetical protein n=1 Tax=Streptomyces griseorubiginosus TaxID=67304 RepID=UPI002E803BDA|nr:hypothetical protein [Streptomyces griseorubiginosus]WUB46044.1 hypothetical protein OHN19_22995 [Streptomyces griseorubiginosus]WUB54565.1 hypothetical protein OG942_22995 [Streptomyces griseorubiginosus]
MTNQPYEGYDQYPQQGWPAHADQGHEDPQSAQQHTQQWQGQTWETQIHTPLQAPPETAYLPQQGYDGDPRNYGTPQGAGGYGAAAQPTPGSGGYGSGQAAPGSGGYGSAQAAPGSGGYGSAQAVPGSGAYGSSQAAPGADAYGPAAAPGPAAYGSAAGSGTAGHGPVGPAPAGDGTAPVGAGAGAGGAQPLPAAQASGAAAPSGYGPATLAGNSRVTDAQRARLEGRSPVIEPGIQPAGLTALLGLLLSGTAAVGSYALLVPLVLLQAVTAAGWFRLNGMWPARQGIALAFLGALVADAALLVAGRSNGPAAILGTLGVWVLLSLVMQLRSHADPDERMYGLMATVASAALAIVATGYLAADPDAVSVGAAAVAVAVLARALPLPTPASVAVALLAAAGAGIAVGGMTGLGAKGALLGAGAAVCALVGHRVASYDYPSRFVHFTAGVALPLAAAAPAVYVLGRAIS